MNTITETQTNSKTANESLADSFLKIGRYVPIFLLISSLGVLVIYILGRVKILGDPTPLLLGIFVPIGAIALLQQAVFVYLARRKQGIAAYFASSTLVAILAVSFVALWQGSIYFVIPAILIMPVAGVMAGMPRKNIPWLVLLVLVTTALIVLVEKSFQDGNRLPFSSPASIASLAFLSATGLLLITITVISNNRSYRSLQSLLLVSFVVIVTIPTVMATILSGVGAYSNSQIQTYNTLKAITNLKENQITLLIDDFKSDANKIQSNARFKQNILPILSASDNDSGQIITHQTLARAFIVSVQKDKSTYAEILILDTKGTVVLSTDNHHINADYEEQLFYRQGTVKFFSGFASLPEFGDKNFVVATPLFDTNGQTIRGVIVLRSDASAIKRIMENTPGYTQAETYLVDKNFKPVTKTYASTDTVRTKAALDAVIENIGGQAAYQNYIGQEVLGYYKWYEPMQMAIIAEVPVQIVAQTSLTSLLGSSLLAILVIIIAIAAVVIAARSITEPIRELAQITESYTAGKFHVRASVNRKDEIGALASSYNMMATELQEIIGKLEQRVTDRTKELESQTLRMRAAAEIARDAAATRDLGDLLESSARLILERFKLYHTGIFLIDKDREFAVLAASPTEAGKQMIANSFKIRMGEADVVGRVASTGEPRISQDLGDGISFKHPLLPKT
ncbi:MAG: HAMP domain-containing protein [Anaerolineales bacterium]